MDTLNCLATSYSHRGKTPTTIGAEKLNFRVRYGNGCDLLAIVTKLFTLRVVLSKLDNAEEEMVPINVCFVLLRLLAFRPLRSVSSNPKPGFVEPALHRLSKLNSR